eukprot:scaffold93860_cov32-Prasinocladus_malaysianus.AAC.1
MEECYVGASSHLNGGAHDVVVWLLSCQRIPRRLTVGPQHERFFIFGIKPVSNAGIVHCTRAPRDCKQQAAEFYILHPAC